MRKAYLAILKIFILAYAFSLANSSVFAQDNTLFFKRYNRMNGLSQNSVYAIAQDNLDFIWLATGKGLNRFDGYSFTNYYHDFDDKESISTSRVVDIAVDKWNRIWLATDGGLNYFDYEKEVFYAYNKTDNDSTSISGDRVKCILVDKTGYLWVGTRTGLNVSILPLDSLKNLPTDKLKFKRINQDLLSNKLITNLFEDDNGDIWVGTVNGLNKIEKDNFTVEQYFFDKKDRGFSLDNQITSIIQDRDRKLWIGTLGGLYTINTDDYTIDSFKNHPFFKTNIRANSIYSILIDHIGRLWIGTNGGGLLEYHAETNSFTVNRNNDGNIHSLTNNAAFTLFEDRSNNLFVSMFGLGFCVTNIKAHKFSLYLHENYNQNKLTDNDVRSILADNQNNLWLGMQDNGLYKLNLNNKEHVHFKLEQLKQNETLPTVKCICSEDSNHLWLGTLTKGLFLFNKKNKAIKEYKYKDGKLKKSIDYVFDIKKDKNKNIWVASWKDGLFMLANGANELIRFTNDKNDKESLSNNNVTSIYIDDDNNVWLTTWGSGISVLMHDSGKFKHYKTDRKTRNSLLSDYCTTIHKDKDGIYWIGTTEGLCSFDKNLEKFTQFSGSQIIFSESIFSIEEDNNSNLWLSTELGISRFSKQTMSIINYDVSDGIPVNQHYIGSSNKLPDGRLTFGGKNGLNIFYPDSLDSQHYNAPVLITSLQLKYKKIRANKEYEEGVILQKSILLTDTLRLSYENNVLSFEFATCTYHKAQTVQYAFMLENFENEWNYVSSDKRVATYTNLDPGKYILNIKATNSDGVWNPQMKKLLIIIESPFWQTAWFIISAILFVIFFLYIIYRKRLSNIEKQKQTLELLVKQKTKELEKSMTDLIEQKEILGETNIQLEGKQKEITEQTEELKNLSEKLQKSNTSLEKEVETRTKELGIALDKAEDARKLISSFLANMSHEVRTPMNAISGFSQLIAEQDLPTELVNKYSNIIIRNIDVLLDLINNIMDASKLHAGQYKLSESTFDLNYLFRIILDKLNETGLKKDAVNCNLIIPVSGNLMLYSDKNAFEQIIYNIAGNALKYTEKGSVEFGYKIISSKIENIEKLIDGEYRIDKERTDLALEIFAKDTGLGIAENEQEIIFNLFQKLENNKEKLYRGSGLGLAIVNDLAKKMNAKIKLESKLNSGTYISVTIPLSEI